MASTVDLVVDLKRTVVRLADEIGERNLDHYDALCDAAAYLEGRMRGDVQRQTYQVGGKDCSNLEVEIPGDEKIIVIGAHYDSVLGSPGANDNGSGVAALVALLEMLNTTSFSHTVRFVAFVNEEPPNFQTESMGSLVYANRCRKRGEQIDAMISLETMGYFSDERGSQRYPFPAGLLNPSTGNFIGFVANRHSRRLVRRVRKLFRQAVDLPSRSASLPAWIAGVGWSDQWSFWQNGYRGLMVTDTAPFRFPQYHTAEDTPDTIDFQRLATVVEGLGHVVRSVAGGN